VSDAGVITVVGIGADGWSGLGERAREELACADTIVGSRRQLEFLPEVRAERRPWPSPIDSLVDALVGGLDGRVCVLASGDPMLHGIGATLSRRARVEVIPHVSAYALACSRLGWPQHEVELVSAVARRPEVVASALAPRRRMVVYVTGRGGAAELARVVSANGFGPSRFVIFEQLGGERESITETTAAGAVGIEADALHCVAIECQREPGAPVLGRTPGLPDELYESDGQLTKCAIRAVTLAALRPLPHALLWDVGAGSGSIAIEWLRAEPSAGAIAIEARAERAQRARSNALRLGVPQLDVREGKAPAALAGLDRPDAVFIGGGLTEPELTTTCWRALRPGGRIVANAVTLEGEQTLLAAQRAHGGALTRLAISHPEPIGRFSAWRPQLPVVQWVAEKEIA
jgi:precorrin-6Y C5,15-methyltransferase (decarboxylating)